MPCPAPSLVSASSLPFASGSWFLAGVLLELRLALATSRMCSAVRLFLVDVVGTQIKPSFSHPRAAFLSGSDAVLGCVAAPSSSG